MNRKMFVNLPVKDLKKTMAFFASMGFTYNPQFTDENAACMIVGEDNYVMLLQSDFFKTFTSKEISDTTKFTEVIISISLENREEVDELMDGALKAGGTPARSEDLGWMYQRGFHDLDGHHWEFFYMDVNAMPGKA